MESKGHAVESTDGTTSAAPVHSARRARLILGLTIFFLCLCIIQLFRLQIIQGPELAAEGQAVRTAKTSVPAKRGAILDASGTVLASSLESYHIAVNQVNIRSYTHVEKNGENESKVVGSGPAEAARQLAPLLGMDEVELGGKLLGDSTFVYLKKDVDVDTYRKIRELNIFGIEWEPSIRRERPGGATAATLIGTINNEGRGNSGLELVMDNILNGEPGEEAYEISPNGAVIPGGKQMVKQPQDGATIHTSIDADLQFSTQKALDERVKKYQADWGSVIVSDPKNGRILVMADSGETPVDDKKPQISYSSQYAFEPGSIGKIPTFITALDEGKISPTTPFYVPGAVDDFPGAGGRIKDYHIHAPLSLTATGIFAMSSNVGTVKIGQMVSNVDRYNTLTKLGFGQITGIELPGETPGVLRPVDQWIGRDIYTSMFGQSYMTTAIQQISATGAIANGGVRVAPHLVDSWTTSDGITHLPDRPASTRVMSEDTAKKLTTMMESVVETKIGTGLRAKVDGYRVAVKTGTAEITVNGSPATVASVAGVYPANNPRLAITVVLYNPRIENTGFESAAPLFAEVVQATARKMGIPPTTEPPNLYPNDAQ